MTLKRYATTSGIIFLAVAVAHLTRLLMGWDFSVGGWGVPSWLSAVAVAVTGYLGYAGLQVAARST